jgi:RNA polymerase sigma factor (sigma-70 family)
MGGDPLGNPAPLIRRVYAYVAYRVGDGAEAEDITSDAFERALRYRSSYDARKGSPQAWLLGIARSSLAAHFAQRGEHHGEVAESASDEDVAGDALERMSVRAAVARLADRDRELIALRYGADLKVREIAELLGERTNTVEVALHRALERLRDELGEAQTSAEPRAQPS